MARRSTLEKGNIHRSSEVPPTLEKREVPDVGLA